MKLAGSATEIELMTCDETVMMMILDFWIVSIEDQNLIACYWQYCSACWDHMTYLEGKIKLKVIQPNYQQKTLTINNHGGSGIPTIIAT